MITKPFPNFMYKIYALIKNRKGYRIMHEPGQEEYFGRSTEISKKFEDYSKKARRIIIVQTNNFEGYNMENDFEFGQAKAFFKGGNKIIIYTYYLKDYASVFGIFPYFKKGRLSLERLVIIENNYLSEEKAAFYEPPGKLSIRLSLFL